MKAHGVTTIYLQTSNYSQVVDVVRPSALGAFLDAAHAAGLHVVGWYLPSLADPPLDRRRALAALGFRSPRGGSFDSFALDIEASVVRRIALRNERLATLAHFLRRHAAAGYPLGAIIPSPVGMARHPAYWPSFPYGALAADFDVFLPMGYYSYHAHTATGAYDYTRRVIRMIHAAPGAAGVPIHVIGGLAGGASPASVAALVRAAHDCGASGVSLYEYPATTPAQWHYLEAARSLADQVVSPSCG
jgi:hypothetical protein